MIDESRTPPLVDTSSLATHLSELVDETTTLFKKELELAKAETSEQLQHLQRGAVWLGSSGAVLYAGGFFVFWGWLDFAARGFDHRLGGELPAWTPWLGLPLLVAGAGLFLFWRRQRRGRAAR